MHCPVRATSAQPLGFGVVDHWSALSSSCTGQSSVTPDSPVPSNFCASDSVVALLCPVAFAELTVGAVSRCSAGSSDSPVNYSGDCPGVSREWLVRGGAGWRTGQCLVHHFPAHSSLFAPIKLCP
jgi:hypothetical protein